MLRGIFSTMYQSVECAADFFCSFIGEVKNGSKIEITVQ
jgi:hypothetical protein